jgi:hypothetical protein
MTFPTGALLGTDRIGVEMRDKINAHFADASQHGSGSSLTVVTDVAALEALTGVADGEHRYLSGYYAQGDGGGGVVRRVASSTATDDGGMVFTSADGGRWLRVWDKGALPAIWYGLKVGDMTDDAAPRIKAAHDYIVATGNSGVVVLPAGRLRWNSNITWDMSYVSLQGNSTCFEVPSTFTGTALRITGTRNPPYEQGYTYMAYFEFHGPGVGIAQCMNLQGPINEGPSNLHFYSIHIHRFHTGVRFFSGAWGTNFIGCSIHDCVTCVWFPTGGANYGERLSFTNTTLWNSELCVKNDAFGGFLHFSQCSFDHSWRVITGAGVTFFSNCHIEQATNTKNTTPILTVGTRAHLSFDNCLFVMVNRGTPTYPHIIDATSLGSATTGIVSMRGCRFWGHRTTSGNFAAGSRVFNQYPSYHDVGTTRFPAPNLLNQP